MPETRHIRTHIAANPDPAADAKDPIAVYFDNQIGMVEVQTEAAQSTEKHVTTVAEGHASYDNNGQLDILSIIAARNEHETEIGASIEEFKAKLNAFYCYVRESNDGKRLIVKMNSNVAEEEIHEDFAKIYRRYKALRRRTVGEHFFKETEHLLDKFCDDFALTVRRNGDVPANSLPTRRD